MPPARHLGDRGRPDGRRLPGGADDLAPDRRGLGRGARRGAGKGDRRMSTAIELRGVEKNFGITSVIRNVNLTRRAGRTPRPDRPQRRRQVDAVQPDPRLHEADQRQHPAARRGDLGPAALPDQPPRPVAQLPGHQRLRQHDGVGKHPLRGAVGGRPPLRVLEEHRQPARGARAHRADPHRHQPHVAARRAGGAADLCRAARAGDRHHHRRRRRRRSCSTSRPPA